MNDVEIKKDAIELIKKLVLLPYSQIFEISPIEQELINLHSQDQNIAEPLIGMMFCAIMSGNKSKAIEYGNKIWNIKQELDDEIEMLYTDCLINVNNFEKAEFLISNKMNDVKKNLELFYTTVVKYALYTGNLYILTNLAKNPEIYISDLPLFDFAKKYYTGMNNKHYIAILKIIGNTISKSLCTTEYSINENGSIQFHLYTSDDAQENLKKQNIILKKINGYYLSMQETPLQDISISIQNIKLHPSWW